MLKLEDVKNKLDAIDKEIALLTEMAEINGAILRIEHLRALKQEYQKEYIKAIKMEVQNEKNKLGGRNTFTEFDI